MSGRFNINGNVGVALNAEPDSTIHLHVHQAPVDSRSEEERRNALLHELFSERDKAGSKEHLEYIAKTVYGDSFFKKLPDQALRDLICIARTFTEYHDELLEQQVSIIPVEQGRTCPQCGKITWKSTALCKHCDMDLERHDQKIRGKRIEKRRVVAVVSALGVATLFFLVGRFLTPPGYSLWINGAAVIVLLFAAALMKE